MGTYDNPQTCCYNFPVMDFGAAAGNTTHWIAGPAGKQGKLREVGVITTEATVFATTLGQVQIGIASNIDSHAILNIATATAVKTIFNTKHDTDAILDEDIDADTAMAVTLIEGTGAGLAGQGYPYVIIDWF